MATATIGDKQSQRTVDRRKGERRTASAPYSGPERRKHERRAPIDLSVID